MATTHKETIAIPLPTEIPPPPRLEQLPHEVLHSATVEMLIQQNEDLSSRLKVNIRRNSSLEQKILELQKQISDLQGKQEILLSQTEIIKEKEKIWSSHKEEKAKQIKTLEKEIELLELRYNEMFTTSQYNLKESQKLVLEKVNLIEKLNKKILCHQKIRAKAKDRLRLFLIDAVQELKKFQSALVLSEQKKKQLTDNFDHLIKDITEKENNFRKELDVFKKESIKKINDLEETVANLKLQNQQLADKHKVAQSESQLFEQRWNEEKRNRSQMTILHQELNSIKNEKIEIKRQHLSAIELLENSRRNEFEKMTSLKIDLEKERNDHAEVKKQLTQCEEKVLDLSRDNKNLSEQLEAIQKLWIETQAQLEKEELRTKNLEKINQHLSKGTVNIQKITQRSLDEAAVNNLDL